MVEKIKEIRENLTEINKEDIYVISNYLSDKDKRNYDKEYLILNML